MTAINEQHFGPGFHPVAASRPVDQRVSLVAPNDERKRMWCDPSTTPGFAFLDDSVFTSTSIARALDNDELDVARIVVDGGFTNGMFLQVLTRIPNGSLADVLWICDDESGFLSSVGRGGDRLLYSLTPDDVRFYLVVNGLVSSM